ncbi:Cannabidiolic acid synthase [Scedosporium apiospermum]|uniref:Cannabidiolic acid synthase n=1 Tax=Pseudallescheria apiosperma TaxID=563466 RepID=A0A084G6X6_PSEDA|nr:Cannabidiolic acid synthase [Scedosporium apiospermum]KEZ43088.1 Cannabidiolic acid synthase [Scedosporium apiospermum]
MRHLSYCRIHDDKNLASIGGGILMADLITALGREGLSTATGMVPWIGFTGWSTYGGYGPFARKFGLGFEQIVAAKLVNWEGKVIEADEDLLKGIKGAGGSFGVIVELTIRTYPLKQTSRPRLAEC